MVHSLSNAWLYASLDFDAAKIRTAFVLIAVLADDQAGRLLVATSPELQKINADQLKKDIAAITNGSDENYLEETPAFQPSQPRTTPTVTGGPHIFISYRRDDSAMYVELLFTTLMAEVPGVHIFHDRDTLQPGMVFSEKINETVAAADFVLAVIGKKWAGGSAKTGTRINQPQDFVRLEIAAALQHNKVLIPCLVDGAKMPRAEDLPLDIQDLIGRNAVMLSKNSPRRDASALIDMFKTWRRPAS